MQQERHFKVLVIGDLGRYRATIGVDFGLKVLNWDHKTVVRLQLWDIAGEFVCAGSNLIPFHIELTQRGV
uniref:Ras-related protein Rab-38 n=1 Tax=Neogobius melanostomus TaxID=47308 RepID=A0A8C6WF58_9GOBI